MRFFLSLGMLVIFVAFGIQLYRLGGERAKLESQLTKLQQEVDSAKRDERALNADLEYFGEEQNILKSARSSNYRAPGEELIIVVPKQGQ